MKKMIKSICLDKEIIEDIENQKEKYGFDFSAWVNDIYKTEFMSIKGITECIKNKYSEIEQLNNKLSIAKERADEIGRILNRNEINFILKVPFLIKEGKEWNCLCKRFNIEFKKDINLTEFQSLVRKYDEDRNIKLKQKINYLKNARNNKAKI